MPRLRNMNLRPRTPPVSIPGAGEPRAPSGTRQARTGRGTPGAAGTAYTDRESQAGTQDRETLARKQLGLAPGRARALATGPLELGRGRRRSPAGPAPGPLSGHDAVHVHVHVHRPTMYGCSRGEFMFGG
jgi:hypothetical protein